MFKPEVLPLPEHREIHRKIKARHFLFRFHYPKTAFLIVCIILAYFLFKIPAVSDLVLHLDGFSYFGIFLAGMFLAFGFTAPFAVGFFITLNPENILLYAVIGAVGALLADMLIFRFVRISFEKEFEEMERTKFALHFERVINRALGHRVKAYLLYGIIGLVIASPLPDEVGVVLLAGLTHVKQKIFGVISLILHFIGILILLGL